MSKKKLIKTDKKNVWTTQLQLCNSTVRNYQLLKSISLLISPTTINFKITKYSVKQGYKFFCLQKYELSLGLGGKMRKKVEKMGKREGEMGKKEEKK